jgi:hypothetical protein
MLSTIQLEESVSMDDNLLAAQYNRTGNLMDLCSTDAWLQELAESEDELVGQIEAGLAMKEYSRAIDVLTVDRLQQLRQQMRVQSILFTQLRQWMESWDLGAGFEDAYVLTRRLIRFHLANPTPTQQEFIEIVELEDSQPIGVNTPTPQQIVAMLSEMLTQEDWQEIAKTASQSIRSQILKVKQSQSEITVA